jgi:hypothetical protein
MDADDKAAAHALITAIAVGVKDGYTTEEEHAIEALWADWREARKNT